MGYEEELKADERAIRQEFYTPFPVGDVITDEDIAAWGREKQKEKGKTKMNEIKTKTMDIAGRLAAIMSEVGAIGKESRNIQQGFNFRGIDAVMNHLHPIFAKHGVFIRSEVLNERTEERATKLGGNLIYRILTIKFIFTDADGSELSTVVIGEGMDTGDKAANKAMAVALKYATTQMFLMPYDEADPDGETHPASKPKGTAKSEAKTKTVPEEKHETAIDTTEVILGEVKTKSGAKNSKKWTRYYALADDGEYYSTFDSNLGAKMTELAQAGEPVVVNYKITQTAKGISRDVVEIFPANPPDDLPMNDSETDTDRKRKNGDLL